MLRRSLQARIVVVTVLLGGLFVLGVGQFILTDIGNGLVEERRNVALQESAGLVRQTQEQLFDADVADPAALEDLLGDLLPRLEASGAEPLREVVLLRALDNADGRVREQNSPTLLASTITDELRAAVAADPTTQHSQVVPVRTLGDDDGDPAVAVGARVSLPLGGDYDLFLLYRLDEEQRSLSLVQNALVLGGSLLVLLVGGIAWLVTRLVVEPVRDAARTAGRLAAGELQERMAVRGEDDLARLASSFNAMAASLQRQIGQLEELSRLQQRFVSDVSHELRTPLTTVRMAVDVLHEQREQFPSDTCRSIELLSAQVDRFEQLLADLLEVSRFDAGAAELDTEAVDVVDVVASSVELCCPIADGRGVVVRRHLPRAAVAADVDRRRLARVVRNLVTNAVEHAEGRPVDVELVATDDAVAVGVRDAGVGLSREQLDRVFDRFWRADPARARTTGGTGLGLAISQEDARLHGGDIEAWGAPGQGAHFVVTVPRQAGQPLGSRPLHAGPPRPPEPSGAPGPSGAAGSSGGPGPSGEPSGEPGQATRVDDAVPVARDGPGADPDQAAEPAAASPPGAGS